MKPPDSPSPQLFDEHLSQLNERQQEAVRATEGPVMVIAGPGTGKTTMLTYRIGYIIRHTDTPPGSILCLTYTDAAATEMRNRLIGYIGPEAYRIQVNTFHGFCNLVIQENPAAFTQARELEPISEIDTFTMLQTLVDQFPDDHPLKRFKGQRYFDWRKLKGLFDMMKAENWSADHMFRQIEAYIARKRTDDAYVYKRKSGDYQKGDFNENKFRKEVLDKMNPLLAAVGEFDNYNRMLAEAGKYDFQDMLRWVHAVFQRDPDLLAEYQERFLYVMVDEFQDTNGIQMAILQQLIDHEWLDRPNVFVVGDDDQAIYRFQGANVENLIAFQEKYNPLVIALDANYRSSQIIIDTARVVTAPIARTLMLEVFGQAKQLVAKGNDADHDHPVHVARYPSLTYENADLFRRIREWHQSGSPDTLAVLYAKHALGEELAQALKGAGIPFTTRRDADILQLPLIGHLLDILRAADALASGMPLDDALLFRILHFTYLAPPVGDLQRIIIAYTNTPYDQRFNLLTWMDTPAHLDGLPLSDKNWIREKVGKLKAAAITYHSAPLQTTVEWIVHEFGFLTWIMQQPEKVAPLSALKTLYTFMEEQAAGRDRFTIPDLLEICNLMTTYGIALPMAHLGGEREQGVMLSTVHGVKGLEFDQVIIKSLTDNEWEKKRPGGHSFALPDNLVSHTRPEGTDEATLKDEDLRRLLYVGMTRARRQLTLGFAEKNDKGKGLTQSQYLAELLTARADIVQDPIPADPSVLTEYLVANMSGRQRADLRLDQAEVAQRVREHVLNPSGLNAYLECPVGFYYDKILRVPSGTAPHMLFGQALHHALEQYFLRRFIGGDEMISREFVQDAFERFMFHRRHQFPPREYTDMVTYGRDTLGQFFDAHSGQWSSRVRYEVEYKIQDIHIEGVPVKGFMDRIDRDGDRIVVYDYKSGKQSDLASKLSRPTEASPHGGSYWRQLVFYDLMLLADARMKRPMTQGVIQGLEPDKDGNFSSRYLEVSDEDRAHVRQLIVDTYARIQAMEFDTGCGNCPWCRMHGIAPLVEEAGDED